LTGQLEKEKSEIMNLLNDTISQISISQQ